MKSSGPPAAEISVVIISAGVSEPSSTRLLADRAAAKIFDVLTQDGTPVRTTVVEVAPLASDIAAALVGASSDRLTAAYATIAHADIVVASTPIYKAGISGLFKSFVDLMDNDLMVGKVVLLAATAGSPRHAMVVDDHLRPLLAFMRAVTIPTSLFAAPDDWADPALTKRIQRAAVEAAVLRRSGLEEETAQLSWDAYQHQFAGSGRHAQDPDHVDFDTPLMRLAAGGGAPETQHGPSPVASAEQAA